jgi:hypothetical protein
MYSIHILCIFYILYIYIMYCIYYIYCILYVYYIYIVYCIYYIYCNICIYTYILYILYRSTARSGASACSAPTCRATTSWAPLLKRYTRTKLQLPMVPTPYPLFVTKKKNYSYQHHILCLLQKKGSDTPFSKYMHISIILYYTTYV